VKAILPGDDDWPADYDLADARFHTISWDFSPSTTSMGIAKVDPRSGEILKADIVMADTWVYSWLHELDTTVPNLTHVLQKGPGFKSKSSRLRDRVLTNQPEPKESPNRKSDRRLHEL